MTSPSLADLRRAFWGAGDSDSTVDAEYEALLASYNAGYSFSDLSSASGPSDYNFKAWTYDPNHAQATLAINDGESRFSKLLVRKPMTVTNLYIITTSAGGTLVAGQNQIALYRPVGTRMHTAGDLDPVYGSAGLKTIAIPGGPLLIEPPFVWVFLLWNFSAGAAPTLARNTSVSGYSNANVPVAESVSGNAAASGVTALPTSITPSALNQGNTGQFWAAAA